MSSLDVIERVMIYPIKSCQPATFEGEPIKELEVARIGFTCKGIADRGLVLVDTAQALFVSQRGWNEDEKPRTAEADRSLARVRTDIKEDGTLVVNEDSLGSVALRFITMLGEDKTDFKKFGKSLSGLSFDPEANRFFSELLKRDVQLLKVMSGTTVDYPYYRIGASNYTYGADGMPFLLTSQESLRYSARLSGLETNENTMRIFRPNIVIDGKEVGAYAEDRMISVRVGDFTSHVVKACARCPIPNVDQQTGEWTGLSNKLLSSHRIGHRISLDETGEVVRDKIYFGQNLNHASWGSKITIAAGDEFEVLEYGASNFVPKSA